MVLVPLVYVVVVVVVVEVIVVDVVDEVVVSTQSTSSPSPFKKLPKKSSLQIVFTLFLISFTFCSMVRFIVVVAVDVVVEGELVSVKVVDIYNASK